MVDAEMVQSATLQTKVVARLRGCESCCECTLRDNHCWRLD